MAIRGAESDGKWYLTLLGQDSRGYDISYQSASVMTVSSAWDVMKIAGDKNTRSYRYQYHI